MNDQNATDAAFCLNGRCVVGGTDAENTSGLLDLALITVTGSVKTHNVKKPTERVTCTGY